MSSVFLKWSGCVCGVCQMCGYLFHTLDFIQMISWFFNYFLAGSGPVLLQSSCNPVSSVWSRLRECISHLFCFLGCFRKFAWKICFVQENWTYSIVVCVYLTTQCTVKPQLDQTPNYSQWTGYAHIRIASVASFLLSPLLKVSQLLWGHTRRMFS